MNRSRLRLPGLALALCAAAGCGDEKPPPPPPPPVVVVLPGGPPKAKAALAQLEGPTGPVTLEREGSKRPAQAEALFAKDAVETGVDGTAVVRLGGDRLVELGAEGRFELDGEGPNVTLNVVRGLVLTRVPARPAGAPPPADDVVLTITTPFGITRVGAASLSMTVDDSSATVDVKVGEIELVSKGGDVSKVGPGRQGTLGTPRELPLLTMNLVVEGGRAELKAKDAKGFVPLNPRKLPTLASGDTVRVKAGAVGLSGDGAGARYTLRGGGEATVGETRRGAGREQAGLELKKGELEVSAPASQSTRLDLGGGVALVSAQGGQFVARRGATGLEVEALTGDVALEREGQPAVLVPAGSSALADKKGQVAVREAPRETVALPARGARLYHSGLKKVSLTWEPAEGGGDYRVQVASDANFEKVVRDGVVHDPFISMPALAKGTWFWRVWRGDAKHAEGSVSFAPEARAQDLSRLKNVVPDGPETTTIFFQDKPPVVTFTWKAEEGAAQYAVKVYREGQLASPVAERTVGELSVALPENTLVEGKYLWSVTPLDAKGGETRGGRMNKLLMVYDNAVPSLVIKTPRNGDPGGPSVRVSGVAPFGARLFVNGKPIALDEKARFDSSVAPFPGGRVIFRLVQGGAEAYTVRTVRGR